MKDAKKPPAKKKRASTRKPKAAPKAAAPVVEEVAVKTETPAPAPAVETPTPAPKPAAKPTPKPAPVAAPARKLPTVLDRFEKALYRGTKGVTNQEEMYVAFLAYAYNKSMSWGPSAITADLEDAFKRIKYLK